VLLIWNIFCRIIEGEANTIDNITGLGMGFNHETVCVINADWDIIVAVEGKA
jgi:hypothetical protein